MPKGNYPSDRQAVKSYEKGSVKQGNKPVSNGGSDGGYKPKRAGK